MIDSATHQAEVETWRDGRYSALLRDLGWLTLAGLGWLKPGVNRIGSARDADVVLPGGPPSVGTITVADSVSADGAFLNDGSPVRGQRLVDDQEGEPTLLEIESLRLCVIGRGGRLAVRTWDLEAPARRAFDGIDHWPVDAAWRVVGRFEPTPGRVLSVPDVLGIAEAEPSPGDVVLGGIGAGHRLQALAGGDSGELWLVFGDATNGIETYRGGRFLYANAPDADGQLVVDFNRAYNPPCVFSPYATCPLPWSANRLPFRVEAGERMYGAPHASSA